jgi:hypothetical protein
MSVPLRPREQKISAKALAMIFHERFAAAEAANGAATGPVQEWSQLPEERQKLLVAVCEQLQGLFLDFGDPGRLRVSYIVSHRTHDGMVQVQLGHESGQMSQDDARIIAYEFLAAADSAETDSVVFRMFNGFDSPENEVSAVNFIAHLRDERQKLRVARIEQSLHKEGQA